MREVTGSAPRPWGKLAVKLAVASGISFSLAALCFAVAPEPKAALGPGDARVPAEGVTSVAVKTTRADITIELTDDADISAHLESSEPRSTVAADKQGGTVAISAQAESEDRMRFLWPFGKREQTKLLVRIPRGLALAELKIKTVSGDIRAADLTFPVLRADTVSGDVILDSLTGDASVESVSGDIHLELNGNADLRSVSGDVILQLTSSAGNSRGHSVSGDLRATLTKGAEVSLDLASRSGDIVTGTGSLEGGRLVLGEATAPVRLALESLSGDIYIDER